MKFFRQIFLTLVLASFTGQTMALKSDRDQPADIEAEDIEFDFKKGTRTYLNNVIAIQGTLRLKADKLIAEYKDSELKKATLWGSLARFATRPDGKEHDVVGSAKQIIVDQIANTLTLIGKAELTQGGEMARGETIVYNMNNDTLKVKGSAKIGSGGKAGAKPKRKLEDPFKDEKVATGGSADKKTNKDSAKNDTTGSDAGKTDQQDSNADQATADKPKVEATQEGRSRLIINPK